MKDKLEPNMYVRIKYGIFKIRKITKDLAYCRREKRVIELDRNIPEYNYRFSFYKDESIFKGAKFKDNIIYLIEAGDYVNGLRVNKIVDGKPIHEDYNDPFYSFGWENDDIKTVITHEQMEQMSYKVGE